ncbi:hypothetical protein C7445_10538 [Alicyclobacillus sacchari]|uniref:Uncharacterized protein n=1 Tax=Alicyclobacillus sacchari TaxID=392010 RepID=A0A4R8LQR6_9BACL|nr:hypothetical protein [Alicyclobacillus sacchari]TDY47863.1 hypothetical protein C7445_10538 [Alicyclobacillus sacchari]GMA55953.1 hypothetical protein GCM10025858_04560 [Alicyclobacillus sacchari]
MQRQLSGSERRQLVERLLERFAARVWETVWNRYNDRVKAEDAFLQVFVVAIRTLRRTEAKTLPDSVIERCLQEVETAAVPHVDVGEALDDSHDLDDWPESGETAALPEVAEAAVGVPRPLLVRAVQVMRANIAFDEALRHHRGPGFVRIGAAGLACVGLGLAVYGGLGEWQSVYGAKLATPVQNEREVSGIKFGSLPLKLAGLYTLPQGGQVDLTHAAVESGSLFLASMQQYGNQADVMNVRSYPLKAPGSLATARRRYALAFVTPVVSGIDETAWQLSTWSLAAIPGWLVVLANWRAPGGVSDEQIYALSLANGHAALVKSIPQQPSTSAVVAVGHGQIAVQSGVYQDGAWIGTPIGEYTLVGRTSTQAWTEVRQIPAAFGFMQGPSVVSDGLVFQGIVGKPERAAGTSGSTWYGIDRQGRVTRYQGPPIDGQPHYVAQGVSGSLWWLETTPNASGGLQLTMAPLVKTAGTAQPMQLHTPLQQFATSGSYLLWVQPGRTNPELVVAAIK